MIYSREKKIKYVGAFYPQSSGSHDKKCHIFFHDDKTQVQKNKNSNSEKI